MPRRYSQQSKANLAAAGMWSYRAGEVGDDRCDHRALDGRESPRGLCIVLRLWRPATIPVVFQGDTNRIIIETQQLQVLPLGSSVWRWSRWLQTIRVPAAHEA